MQDNDEQYLRELYEPEPLENIGRAESSPDRIGREEHSLATKKEKAAADLKEYRRRKANLQRQLQWAQGRDVSPLALRKLRSKIRFVARLIQKTQQQYDTSD